MDTCPVRAEQVLDGHGRPLRTTLSRPSDCAKYEIMLDVALHFGPEDHSCAEKLNKNNDQIGRETLQLFKSGLGPLQQAYGFQFGREHVVRLDPERVYQVLRDWKLIDVGMVFATDGRIAAYDLLVLEDDKEFFPNYAMAPVVRKQSLERHPNLAVYLGSLAAVLDNETMARLNGLIDVRGDGISEVASEFLRSRGLL